MNTNGRLAALLFSALVSSAVAQTPVILTQPQSQTVNAGNTVAFSVSVSNLAQFPAVSSGTLRLWLKADAGVVTNASGKVSQWQDQSGNVNHASAPSVAAQPSLVQPAALNGRSAIRFDGIQDNVNGDYLHGSGDVGISNAYTSFIVYNALQLTNNENALTCVGTPGVVYGASRLNGISAQKMVYSGWADDYPTPFVVPTNTFRIWTDRVNTNLSQVEIFDSTGTSSTNFTYATSGFSSPAPEYFIGGLDPSYTFVAKGRNLNGDIAEILFFRGQLSNADRLAVEQYLKNKYFPNAGSAFTYQWRLNGSDLNGQTNSTLTVTNAQNVNAGTYTVLVSGNGLSTLSSNAVLTVLAGESPIITTQPQSQTVIAGTSAAFSVVVSNSAQLPAVNSGTLRLWLKADAGVVTNGAGQVSQWQDQTTNANHASQSTSANQPLLSTSALMNGRPVVRFDGIANASTGDYLRGTGDVAIPNAFTAFWVYSAKSFPDPQICPWLVGVPGGTYGACRDNFFSSGQMVFSTWANDYVTGFYPATNTARIWIDRLNTNLTSVDVTDVTATTRTNFTKVTSGLSAPAAGYYVGGLDPTVGFTGYPYRFAGDMAELLIYRGSLSDSDRTAVEQYLTSKYLSASSGASSFTYQWRFNGTNISNATNSNFTIGSSQLSDVGTYDVVVCNGGACTTSSGATLGVTNVPPQITTQPQSQIVVVGDNATFSVGVPGAAQFPAVNSGTLRLWLKADAGVVTNVSGKVSQWQDQSGNANHASAPSAAAQPSLVKPVALNGRSAIRFDGIQDNVNGDYLHGSGDVGIPDAYTSFIVYNALQLTNNENALTCVGTPGVVYGASRLNGISAQKMVYSGWADDYPTPFVVPTNTFRIWTDRVNTNLSQVEIFDSTGTSSTNFTYATSGFSSPAAEYFIGGLDPAYTFVAKGRNLNGDIAEILFYRGQLSNADRLAVEQYLKDKYLFNVGGDTTYTYQWQLNGAALDGQTNSTLTIANAQTNNAGTYNVVVCNSVGCTTSSNAVLRVETNTLSVGLVAYYPFSGNAQDASGTGNNGNPTNVVYGLDRNGQAGAAADFSGGNAWVDVPTLNAMNYTPVTYSAWFKLNNWPTDAERRPDGFFVMGLLGRDNAGSQSQGMLCLYNPGPRGQDHSIAYYTGQADVPGQKEATTNKWTHVVFTMDSSNHAIFYWDGQLLSSNFYTYPQTDTIPFRIGASAASVDYRFRWRGLIDDVRIYNRALSSNEVAQLYSSEAPPPGIAPSIDSQPVSQTVAQGADAAFAVGASGAATLTYQWRKDGVNIAGATNSALTVTNAQGPNIGSYTVVVANGVGSVTSSAASLTIQGIPNGIWQGLIAYYPFSGNAQDASGSGNNGNPTNVTYGADRNGQAGAAADFSSGNAWVDVPTLNAMAYKPVTYSLWFNLKGYPTAGERRSSDGYNVMTLIGRELTGNLSEGALCLYTQQPYLTNHILYYTGYNGVDSFQTPATNQWIHVTFTEDASGNASFYWNGQFLNSVNYTYPQNANLAFRIGASAALIDYRSGWRGLIDDVRVYNRALSSNEVAQLYASEAPLPPTITLQPVSQTVLVGGSATFTATGSGSGPLSYQWLHNGANVAGATTTSLSIASAQLADAGSYALVVSNAVGTATSSNAVLQVNASTLIAGNVTGAGSSTVVEPISLIALGGENALGFSLAFDPAVLSLTSVSLGSNSAGATLFFNTNQAASGKVGVIVSLPSGSSFAAGTQQVALVTFQAGLIATQTVTGISFADSPTTRQISDQFANSLPASFVNGSATLTATVFEGDVSPRPSGNQNVTTTDWVQVGRFVAGLDTVSSPGEFQRADCAPRNNLGNGQLSVSDWVQAGRYAVGLDPLTPVGGPTGSSPHLAYRPKTPTSRTITLDPGTKDGVTNIVKVQLNATGNENAVGFSLSFDSQLLQFVGANIGAGASGASLNVNTSQALSGVVGVALAMPIGQTFASGTQECVRLIFVPTTYSSGTSNLAFTDTPVIREVSDVTANVLSAAYIDSSLAVSGLVPPALNIGTDGSGNVIITWPAATGFGLESVSSIGTNWSAVPTVPVTNGGNATVTQPVSGDALFFRLRKP